MRRTTSLTANKLNALLLNAAGDPFGVLALGTVTVLALLTAVPLFLTVCVTFVDPESQSFFTLRNWQDLFLSHSVEHFWEPLTHTLSCAFLSATGSVLLGGIYAWLLSRSSGVSGRVLLGLLSAACMVPSWMKALAWLAVFRGGGGGADGLLTGLGVPVPAWLSGGPVPLVLCMTFHCFPFSCLLFFCAYQSLNREYQEMALLLGAGRWRLFRRITLPLMMPAAAAAACLTMSECFGAWGAAVSLGSSAGYETLVTQMRKIAAHGFQPAGYAAALVLGALSALVLYDRRRFFLPYQTRGLSAVPPLSTSPRVPASTSSATARVVQSGNRSTSSLHAVLPALLWTVLLLTEFLPLLALAAESFQIVVGGGCTAENLTLSHWFGTLEEAEAFASTPGLIHSVDAIQALLVTLRLGILVSVITVFLGKTAAFVRCHGQELRAGRITGRLSALPTLAGGAVLSAAFACTLRGPFMPHALLRLSSSIVPLAAVSIAAYLPFAMQSDRMCLIAADASWDAASASGVRGWRKIRLAFQPLMEGSLTTVGIPLFLLSVRELDLFILTASPSARSLSVLALACSQEGFHQMAAAVCTVLLVFLLLTFRFWRIVPADWKWSAAIPGNDRGQDSA